MSKSWKLLTTLSLCGTAISLGISTVIHGTTLQQLRFALDLSMGDVGFVFPAFGIGNILGTIPAGLFPISGRRRHLVAFLVAILGAVMMTFIPYSEQLSFLLVAFTLFGFTYGYLDTDLTTIVTEIWTEDSPPYLVALRSSASVGVFLGGFICVPFVTTPPHHSDGMNRTATSDSEYPNTDEILAVRKLEWVYLVGVGAIAISATFMIVMLLTGQRRMSEETTPLMTAVRITAPTDTITVVATVFERQRFSRRDKATVFLFAVAIATTTGSTAVFCNFLASFTTNYLGASPEMGALLVSLYGGCTLLSNSIVTVVVKQVKSSYLATLTCLLSIAAFAIISFFSRVTFVIWLTTALFGLGNVPTMCLAYVTAEQFNYLTKGVAGIFSCCTGVATLLSTLLVATLFETNAMSMMYFCGACTVTAALAYCTAILVNRRTPYYLTITSYGNEKSVAKNVS